MSPQNNIDPDLPDDLQDEIAGDIEATQEQINALTATLVSKRTEAIAARKASGIEEVWMICEESYIGIDDANRAEFANAKWAKPTSMEGPVTTNYTKQDNTRSSAFVRLTSRYVDAGSAKLSEILLPIDDKAFAFSPTPVPDLVKGKDDMRPVNGPDGQPMYRDQTPDEIANAAMQQAQGSQPPAPPPGSPPPAAAPAQPNPPPQGMPPSGAAATPPAPQKVQMTVADFAKAQWEAAEDAAEKAETRIYDWMIECNSAAETRKVVFDASRIGVGVLKGPVPDIQKSQALTKDGDAVALEMVEKIVPIVKWIDPWNFFPDGACGEDIRNGDYTFERDHITSKTLKELKKQKGYIADAIDTVIKQGPGKCNEESDNPNDPPNKNRFEIWYWYGTLSMDDMQKLNANAVKNMPDDQEDVYAIVTMVNDTVIRATINPMDSGTFPYHVFPWSRRPASWAGVGIAEQVSMPQRMVNASTRALLNNAGVSAGAQVIIDRLNLTPADGNWNLTPNKIWYNLDGMPIEDVSKVFAMIEFPNVGEQLMNVINYAFKLAEEQSNIPLIAQGQIATDLPKTLGAAQLLDSNANTLLRNIGYSYDDHITEPVVRAFYEWLLLDDEVPDDEKGDFKINAHGSSALVERAIQSQNLAQIGALSLQPAYEVDPAKWMSEWLRSLRFDPRKMQYTEEQIAQRQAAPPPPPVQVQVAQLNAQSRQSLAQTQAQSDAQLQQQKSQQELQMIQAQAEQEQQALANGQSTPHMAQAQGRIETARIQAESQQSIEQSRANSELAYAKMEQEIAQQNAAADIQKLQLQRELAMLQYANAQKISLSEMQSQLAKTAMVEQTKRQLGAADMQAQQTENAIDRHHDMTKHVISTVANASEPAGE